MLSFKLDSDDGVLPINNTKKYSSKSLKMLKKRVDTSKNQLDVEFKNNRFPKYWRLFDPFRAEKTIVAKLGCTFNVTNAWLKCFEIIDYFGLIPEETKTDFVHFDNAAFPGSFVVSTHHYVMTKRSWGDRYKWYASSLHESTSGTHVPLVDKYALFQRYPENWLMHGSNNGDVLNSVNQRDFCDKIGPCGKNDGVDLYTSDLGFDSSSDYNNQELIHAQANIGQILSGILTLRKGGSFVTKQYTTFEMITISAMYALSQLFHEFYICKPITSREANSETYLIGKGFKGGITIDHPYVKAMFDRIDSTVPIQVPLFLADKYAKSYLKRIVDVSEIIFNQQIAKINSDVKRCNESMHTDHRGKPSDNPVVVQFQDDSEELILTWYKKMGVVPIDKNNMLNMTDAYHQR
jgi:hypothetical protein